MIKTELEFIDAKYLVKKFQSRTYKYYSNQNRRMFALISAYNKKEKELDVLMRKTTPYYNVFEILKIRHYEAKVHTPFIAHLLNPCSNATHQQRGLFFELFFSIVLEMDFKAISTNSVRIETERRNQYGQCDIEIWFKGSNINKVILIENKIYHHDGDEQLYRYYQYLRSCGIADEQMKIIYLTIGGHNPSAQSCRGVPKGIIENKSYRVDIYSWLVESLSLLDDNLLKNTIIQYIKTIHSL